VRPALERLAAQTKESASFWVLENGHRVCLCRVESQQNVREAMFREGDRRPLDKGPTSTLLRAFSGAKGKRFDEVRRDVAAVSIGLYRAGCRGNLVPGIRAGRRARRRGHADRAAPAFRRARGRTDEGSGQGFGRGNYALARRQVMEVTIVGGGIGGLTLALMLHEPESPRASTRRRPS
jgi:hypothetical protein